MKNKKALKINEVFDFDVTNMIVNSAISICFSKDDYYINGVKEFAIRSSMLVYLTNVDLNTTMDFKEMYREVLYGDIWEDFLTVNSSEKKQIALMREIISDAIDKYFYVAIQGDDEWEEDDRG